MLPIFCGQNGLQGIRWLSGLGAALELGLEIIATMLNGEEAEKVANAIQYIG